MKKLDNLELKKINGGKKCSIRNSAIDVGTGFLLGALTANPVGIAVGTAGGAVAAWANC